MQNERPGDLSQADLEPDWHGERRSGVRWLMVGLLSLALAAVGGSVAYFLWKPEYEASAWLRIEDSVPYIAFEAKDNSSKYVDTQVEILRSPLVLGPVVSRSEIQRIAEIRPEQGVQSPLDYLAQRIQVKRVKESELFMVSWRGPVAADAASIVNAVVDSYMELRRIADVQRVQRVIELVQQERDRQENQVRRLQERIRQLAKDNFLGEQEQAAEMPLVKALQLWLVEVQAQRLAVEAKIAACEESFAAEAASHEDSEAKQEEKAEDAEPNASRESPNDQGKGPTDDTLSGLKSELAELRYLERVVGEKLVALHPNAKSSISPEDSRELMELEFLKGDLAREQEVFNRIASRLVALKTEQRAPERVMLLQRAEVPETPVVSFPTMRVAGGAIGGFCAVFVVVGLWNVLRRKKRPAAST